jgi:hypothetical protein
MNEVLASAKRLDASPRAGRREGAERVCQVRKEERDRQAEQPTCDEEGASEHAPALARPALMDQNRGTPPTLYQVGFGFGTTGVSFT